MAGSPGFVDYILELLAPLGGVQAKRMFGGHGVYLDGLMFAIIDDDNLYLKADDQSRALFEDQGLTPFTYQSKGKTVTLSYYQAPVEALDESDALCEWARHGFEAALRAQRMKSKKQQP